MKKFLVASAAVLGIAGTASAADLAVRTPIVAPPPAFSWTGIYIGIGGGTGWGNKDYSWDQDATRAALFNQGLLPPLAGGLRLGGTQGSHPTNGGFFGGQLGANWQSGWAVFGIQGDAHWADIDGRGDCFNAGAFNPLAFSCTDKVRSFGTVTGRVGAAVDRALIYAKGGWAWEDSKRTVTASGAPLFLENQNLAPGLGLGTTLTAASVSQYRSGWTFGAGVEYAFAPSWSAFVEYDHLDFGTKGLNTTLALTVPGLAPGQTVFNVPISANVKDRFDVVKAGVNYTFNWWSAPVVARY